MQRFRLVLLVSALAGFVETAPSSASTASALEWCAQSTTAPSCPTEFMAVAPQCLASGFRSCLIEEARKAAAADNCRRALQLARTCQCHNAGVRNSLDESVVCDWLRSH
jgi:hypothetical protein